MAQSIVYNKIQKMIDDKIINSDTIRKHIRLNKLNRIINKEEEISLYKLLNKN